MIVVDELFDTSAFTKSSTPRCFRNSMSCHMSSSIEGPEGTKELIAFAVRIGLKPHWIQHQGDPFEHFDLTESKRKKAVSMGATEVPRGWHRTLNPLTQDNKEKAS